MPEPWIGQLGAAGLLAAALFFVIKAFVGSIDRRITEQRAAHDAELVRLKEQHERELGDMRQRANAWESAAARKEQQVAELWALNGRLQAGNDTAVQILTALRKFASERDRELGTG